MIALDKRYRSSWDTRSIGHVVGLSPSTVAKILREERGPRPKRARPQHVRRTKFVRRDVMWSSDFMELPNKSKLLKTLDEMSRYKLGWELVRSESAQDLVVHAWQIIERMGRKPLVWKFDHGSAFMSQAFQTFLAEQQIVPYPTPPRAPWANGRTERDNKEVRNWLIPVEKQPLDAQAWEREIDEGMWMLNFIKPRSVLGLKSSASVYFEQPASPDPDRVRFLAELGRLKTELEISCNPERTHRKAVRRLLQDWKLYEEWLPEAEIVNRLGAALVP